LSLLIDKTKKTSSKVKDKILRLTNLTLDGSDIDVCELRELEATIIEIGAKDKKRKYENESDELKSQIHSIRKMIRTLPSEIENVKDSFGSVRDNLRVNGAGDFYVMKGVVAALEIARREKSEGVPIDFKMSALTVDNNPKNKGHVFSFAENDNTGESAWYKIHLVKKQMPALRFVAESILNNKNDK
jgi:hypothetical protein